MHSFHEIIVSQLSMINVSVDNDFVYFFEDEIKLYFLRFNIPAWYINEFTIIDFTIYTRLFS